MLYKRALSDLVFNFVDTESAYPVGDAHEPKDVQYGWTGTPNEPGSYFTPYIIITPSSSQRPDGAIGDSQTEWRISYIVSGFGASRQQAEFIADNTRDIMVRLSKQSFNDSKDDYKIQQVRNDMMGQVVSSKSTEPPVFGQSDSYTIWVSKD